MGNGQTIGKPTVIFLFRVFPNSCRFKHVVSHSKEQEGLFMTDNESVVHVINKQTSRDTLSLIRKMVLICVRNNILFRAKHIPGIKNGLADSLSRLQVSKFKGMSQGMDRVPTLLPRHLRLEVWEIP